MLTLKKIREEKDQILKQLMIRGVDFSENLNIILELDQKYRKKLHDLESDKSQINKISKEIGVHYSKNENEKAEKLKSKTGELKEKSRITATEVEKLEQEIRNRLLDIPNPPEPSVPPGRDDTDNEVITQKGSAEPGKSIPHWEIAEKFKIIDFESGNKVTGAGFPFYRGYGAKLQRALITFFLNKAAEQGYEEFQPPLIVNEDSGFGTGQLPDKEGQMYHISNENLYLIPTAEVPLTNLYRDRIVLPDELPARLTAYTPCFRREAGSHGKDVRGLNRLHQFDKVEIVQITTPENSWDTLETMRNYIESLISDLGLPYRVLKLCGGDLGFASAFTYDMEIYSPGQNRWLEVSSVSNFLDFQSNRMQLRMKTKDGKVPPHTLNGSALALPRTLAALLEHNYDGNKILIPEVLHPYTGFDHIPAPK